MMCTPKQAILVFIVIVIAVLLMQSCSAKPVVTGAGECPSAVEGAGFDVNDMLA